MGPFGATGGADSAVFGRPLFQTGVRSVVGNHRGTPDISMSAAVDVGAYVYTSFLDPTSHWNLFGGTSLSSPMFSGIVAMADQVAGHRLGDINPALYLLGAASRRPHSPLHTGLVDVTAGDNSFDGVAGFPAVPGFDLSTGWGTLDAKDVRARIGADEPAHSVDHVAPFTLIIRQRPAGIADTSAAAPSDHDAPWAADRPIARKVERPVQTGSPTPCGSSPSSSSSPTSRRRPWRTPAPNGRSWR